MNNFWNWQSGDQASSSSTKNNIFKKATDAFSFHRYKNGSSTIRYGSDHWNWRETLYSAVFFHAKPDISQKMLTYISYSSLFSCGTWFCVNKRLKHFNGRNKRFSMIGTISSEAREQLKFPNPLKVLDFNILWRTKKDRRLLCK